MLIGIANRNKLLACCDCFLHRRDSVTAKPPLLACIAIGRKHILLPNVTDQLHLLASGTRACLAGEVPEVRLRAQVLAESVCSAFSFVMKGDTLLWSRVRYKKRRSGGKGKEKMTVIIWNQVSVSFMKNTHAFD